MLTGFKDIIRKKSLMYSVGQAIYCLRCKKILDWRTSVEVTLYKKDEPVYCKAICCECYDETLRIMTLAINKVGLKIETIDGRCL